MRSSLWFKLMGILLVIVGGGVIIMLVATNLTTTTQFRRFVLSSDVIQARELSAVLSDYYAWHESWEGVEAVLDREANGAAAGEQGWGMGGTMGPGMMPGIMRWMDEMSEWMQQQDAPLMDRIVLLDESGGVVADSAGVLTGEQHPPEHLKQGVPVVVDDQVVGMVLVGSMIEPALNPLDEDFLRSVNRSVLVTAVAVGLVGLVLGSLLVRQITAPVGAMSAAAEAIAGGDLNRRVPIASGDEIGRLGRSFNRMAESLARAEVLRRNMVADIAHELRTPLSVIQGNLEALLDGVFPLDREHVAVVHEETLLLSRLVADLRDLALAEAGELRLELSVTDVAEVIAGTVKGFQAQAGEKGVTLAVEQPAELPLVMADEQRLAQVLHNLLNNGLRHTPVGGTVTVRAKRVGDEVQVTVADTGEGIPAEALPYVFERFYRADRSRARTTGGSGLGLAIAKRIVEAHGGRIWARSWLGAGSTFAFSLPLLVALGPATEAAR
ncbi:MAG: ATP-binding protein [Anaerolineae bacterium]